MDSRALNVLVVNGEAGNVIVNRPHSASVEMLLSVSQAEAWIRALQDALTRHKATVESPEGKVYHGRS